MTLVVVEVVVCSVGRTKVSSHRQNLSNSHFARFFRVFIFSAHSAGLAQFLRGLVSLVS